MTNYTIIGSGPSGIVTAILLTKLGHKCILIDRNTSIGGCHRVDRVENYFSEHGPRIYQKNFVNFIEFLLLLDIDFHKIFKKYKYSFPVGITELFKLMTIRESIILFFSYTRFIINPSHFEKITVKDLLNKYNYSKKVKNYFDKICKLTDGAGINKFTCYELFQLLNQGIVSDIYEPKYPNDEMLWKKIKNKMNKLGIKVISNTSILQILKKFNTNKVNFIITDKGEYIHVKNLICAIPPYNLFKILSNSDKEIKNNFMRYNELEEYVYDTNYIPYLSFTMHWDKKIKIKEIWGNGFGEWGIIWINMSDYFKDNKTLLSCSIVELNTKSNYTNKTVNETLTINKLLEESYRQVNNVLDIPHPDKIIMNKAVKKSSAGWETDDTAYIKTVNSFNFPFIGKIDNLYSLGCHNETSNYAFTSIESAVVNSINLCTILDKRVKNIIRVKKLYTFNKMLFQIISIAVIIIILIIFVTKIK